MENADEADRLSSPTVTVIRKVPSSPWTVFANIDVSESHAEDSQAVLAKRVAPVATTRPSPEPMIVTATDPVPALFVAAMLENELDDTDQDSVAELCIMAIVTPEKRDLAVDWLIRHFTNVSEFHSLLSQELRRFATDDVV